MRRFILLLVTLVGVVPLMAQSAPNSREFTFQVSSSPPWFDTALNLQPGDSIQISATRPSATSTGNGSKQGDPAGLSDSGNPSTLHFPEAGLGDLIAKLNADACPVLVGAHSDLRIDKP